MSGKTVKREWRNSPSTEYRFFLYDPEGNGFMFFKTAEDRDKASVLSIGEYCDDGWSEEVSRVCAGELTHVVHKCNVNQKPQRNDFASDEEFEDAAEDWNGGDFDETCDYELCPLAAPSQAEQPK